MGNLSEMSFPNDSLFSAALLLINLFLFNDADTQPFHRLGSITGAICFSEVTPEANSMIVRLRK